MSRVIVLLLAVLFIASCNSELANEPEIKTPTIKNHLLRPNSQWLARYDDTIETALIFNIVVQRFQIEKLKRKLDNLKIQT